jgi:hypothetical protein
MYSSVEKIVISELLGSNSPLPLFFFHQKYGFSPSLIVAAIKNLTESDIVEFRDQRVRLTPQGLRNLIKLRNRIFRRTFDFKSVPVWAVAPKRAMSEFVRPELNHDRRGRMSFNVRNIRNSGARG